MSFKLNKVFSIILKIFFICIALIVLVFTFTLIIFSQELPNYKELANYSPSTVSRLYACDGKLIEEYSKEHRLFVPISSISKNLISAFLAAEDKNFYDHPGLDYNGLFRAIFYNIKNIGNKNIMGGSTITQQVVKNLLLTNEKSLKRKIKEALLAVKISKIYSKDQILELYLNQIYLGARSYGVASAAVNYFNKSIDNLTIEEAALLAALPQAPSNLDPYKFPERAKIRRDWVIKRMGVEGFINKETAENAILKPIKLQKKSQDELVKAPFFAEEVRKQLLEAYGDNVLYEGGLVVSTTLDSNLQAVAEKALQNGLMRYDRKHGYHGKVGYINSKDNFVQSLSKIDVPGMKPWWQLAVIKKILNNRLEILLKNSSESAFINSYELNWVIQNKKIEDVFKVGDIIIVSNKQKNQFTLEQIPKIEGAIVVMNPHNGAVKAMSGGWDYNYNKFNRATQAKRQMGSAFKSFIYLAAFENGFTPSSVFVDEPIQISQGPRMPIWEPQNITKDYIGPITLRTSLEQSRNITPIKLAQELGINKIIEITKRFGLDSDPKSNLSIALGTVETNPLKVATAYSMIANGGKKLDSFFIDKIQDKKGHTIFKTNKVVCNECIINNSENELHIPVLLEKIDKVTDERSAFQLTSILEGAVLRGTARKAANLKKVIAGKTGTTNESNDAWFIGYTPDLVVVVYIGFDIPRSLGRYETGSSIALPICIDFFREALKGKPDLPFKVPQGIKLMKVDYNTGLPSLDSSHLIYEAFKTGTEPKIEEEDFFDNKFIN